MTIEKYPIPVWALAYIINADASGYSVEETDMIDGWLELMSITHVCCPDDVDSLKYFEPYPRFGLACDVVECDCYIKNLNTNNPKQNENLHRNAAQ